MTHKKFTCLTLNTWQERGPWKVRWELIFQGIQELQPDVIAFQEVFNQEWAMSFKEKAGYPYLVMDDSHCGLVICSKFPFQETGSQILKRSPLEYYDRGVLWAKVDFQPSSFYVINTHLSWKPQDSKTRLDQAVEVANVIENKTTGFDVLLMGDHNAEARTEEMQYLIQEAALEDVYDRIHPKSKALTWDNQNKFVREASEALPDRRIDYIFKRKGNGLFGKIEDCQIVFTEPSKNGVWASDHYGVVATFSVQNQVTQ